MRSATREATAKTTARSTVVTDRDTDSPATNSSPRWRVHPPTGTMNEPRGSPASCATVTN